MKTIHVLWLAALVSLVSLSTRAEAFGPATYCADDLNDGPPVPADCPVTGACTGNCSLRDAIAASNAHATVTNTIIAHAGTHLMGGTIADRGEDANVKGDFDITNSLIIQGASPGETFIDGNGIDRLFDIDPLSTGPVVKLELYDLTILNGNPGASDGGAIYDHEGLVMNDCAVRNNTAGFNGGGIAFSGGGPATTLKITNSTINTNISGGAGGGLSAVGSGGDLTLVNSTVSGNQATGAGGGLRNNGTTILRNVTVTGNTADSDGDDGAGEDGGGMDQPSGAWNVKNSIIAGNFDHSAGGSPTIVPDCSQSYTSGGYNLIGDGTGCTGFSAGSNDLVGTSGSPINPRLAALAHNGGPVILTQALQAGSPALNAGNTAGCVDETDAANLTADERGFARPIGGRCDIGAYENGTCGDGAVDASEDCDDGLSNSDTLADACRTSCTNPQCGDGVVDTGEDCDDGNTDDTDACKNDCTLPGAGTTGGTTTGGGTTGGGGGGGGCSLIR